MRSTLLVAAGLAVGLAAALVLSELTASHTTSAESSPQIPPMAADGDRDSDAELTAMKELLATANGKISELERKLVHQDELLKGQPGPSMSERLRDGDTLYSRTRLSWVMRGPLHWAKKDDPVLLTAGLGPDAKGTPTDLFRMIEGEALGIGQGHYARFQYLPALGGSGNRSEIFDRLREDYSHLVVLDESNGAAGETHVARLTPGLSVAVFGSWYNPWGLSVVSATRGARHSGPAIREWARVSGVVRYGYAHEETEGQLLDAVRTGTDTSWDDWRARCRVWIYRDAATGGEQFSFEMTSLHSPVRVGAPPSWP